MYKIIKDGYSAQVSTVYFAPFLTQPACHLLNLSPWPLWKIESEILGTRRRGSNNKESSDGKMTIPEPR